MLYWAYTTEKYGHGPWPNKAYNPVYKTGNKESKKKKHINASSVISSEGNNWVI